MSAASKIMWMHDRDKTLIFDSRARTALDRMRATKETKLPARDYQTFYARWEARYGRVKTDIKNTCDDMRVLNGHDVLGEEWFRRRVFDAWLWDAGG